MQSPIRRSARPSHLAVLTLTMKKRWRSGLGDGQLSWQKFRVRRDIQFGIQSGISLIHLELKARQQIGGRSPSKWREAVARQPGVDASVNCVHLHLSSLVLPLFLRLVCFRPFIFEFEFRVEFVFMSSFISSSMFAAFAFEFVLRVEFKFVSSLSSCLSSFMFTKFVT